MFDGQPKEISMYETLEGFCPFVDWISNLRDRAGRRKIQTRLTRLEEGNPGKYRSVGEGVLELKIDFGPGYRVYLAFSGTHVVLLLCGGDKDTQDLDIETAKTYWRDQQERGLL